MRPMGNKCANLSELMCVAPTLNVKTRPKGFVCIMLLLSNPKLMSDKQLYRKFANLKKKLESVLPENAEAVEQLIAALNLLMYCHLTKHIEKELLIILRD